MKKLLTIIIVLMSLGVMGQTIYPYPNYGNKTTLLQENYRQINKYLRIPHVTDNTPVFNNGVDSVASGFQLLNNGSLAISKGLGAGFWLYPSSTALDNAYVSKLGGSTIVPSGTGIVGLNIQGMVGQVSNLQQWRNSGGTVIGYFSNGGQFLASNSVVTPVVTNTSTGNNASLAFNTTGLLATSNKANSDNVFTINQLNSGSTGKTFVIQNEGGEVVSVSKIGRITALEFARTGGTSSMFLKGDGSVDVNTYTTTAASALKQNLVTLTTTGTSGAATFNQSTGALNIPNYATGSGTVTSFGKTDGYGITSSVANPTTTPVHTVAVDTTSATGLVSKARQTALNASLVHLAGSESITGVKSFNNQVNISHPTLAVLNINNTNTTASGGFTQLQLFATGSPSATNAKNFSILNLNGIAAGQNTLQVQSRNDDGSSKASLLSITQSGAVTIPNTLDVTGATTSGTFVKSGGTSSQFLKADGSVDATAYGTGTVTNVSSANSDISVATGTTTPVLTFNSANYIQNQTASDQVAGFRVSGTSYTNGGIESRDFYRLRKTGSLAFAMDLQTTAPTANRIQTLQDKDGTIALTSDATGYVVNTTTVGLSSATLNSTYPDVPVGYRVICGSITLGGAIYVKYTEAGSSDVWLLVSAPVAP